MVIISVEHRLKEDASVLRKTVQDIDTLLRVVEFDAEKLAQNTHAAFQRLNSQLNGYYISLILDSWDFLKSLLSPF